MVCDGMLLLYVTVFDGMWWYAYIVHVAMCMYTCPSYQFAFNSLFDIDAASGAVIVDVDLFLKSFLVNLKTKLKPV